jgi:hypothetical protein
VALKLVDKILCKFKTLEVNIILRSYVTVRNFLDGDSEVELLNDVIEIIQQHYESSAEQIRLIQKLRMQKG